MPGVSPGRHEVSVYRNQVKKKISAAGVTPKLRVTAMTWTERSRLHFGRATQFIGLGQTSGEGWGSLFRGEVLQQKFFSLELEGKRKPQTSMQRSFMFMQMNH